MKVEVRHGLAGKSAGVLVHGDAIRVQSLDHRPADPLRGIDHRGSFLGRDIHKGRDVPLGDDQHLTNLELKRGQHDHA